MRLTLWTGLILMLKVLLVAALTKFCIRQLNRFVSSFCGEISHTDHSVTYSCHSS